MKLLFTTLLLLFSVNTYSMEVGEKIKPFQLEDQHEKIQKVDTSFKLIIFARDDDANKVLAKALAKTNKTYLPKRKAIYVADISKMPGFVASWFALPKMRKYTYLSLLDRKPELTKIFPAKKSEITLIYLKDLTVEKIEYYKNPFKLRKVLDGLI